MDHFISKLFIKFGLNQNIALIFDYIVLIIAVVVISLLVNYVIKRFIVGFIQHRGKKSQFNHFRLLAKHHVFQKISHLAPSLIILYAAPLIVIDQFPVTVIILNFIQIATKIYFIAINYLIVSALLDYSHDVYKQLRISTYHPIKSYIQIFKIAFFIIQVIVAISILLNKSPLVFLTGIGAMTALVSFMLKDSLLGFVASIQLSTYDMIRVGDWVEVPTFGADGDVIDMSLNTVKVQNFDKTIVTIPTSALLTTTVKNWRGMSEAGGRRIKRAIYIDLSSIHFCSEEEIQRYRQLPYLADYLNNQSDRVEQSQPLETGKDKMYSSHQHTNVTLFRAYLVNYLKNCPRIRNDLTLMVRQLDITGKGLPIEIYVFANTTDWLAYESIQSDLFDHFLAIIPFFHLRVFQNIIDRSSINQQLEHSEMQAIKANKAVV